MKNKKSVELSLHFIIGMILGMAVLILSIIYIGNNMNKTDRKLEKLSSSCEPVCSAFKNSKKISEGEKCEGVKLPNDEGYCCCYDIGTVIITDNTKTQSNIENSYEESSPIDKILDNKRIETS